VWVRHWYFGISIRGGFEVVGDNAWDTPSLEGRGDNTASTVVEKVGWMGRCQLHWRQ